MTRKKKKNKIIRVTIICVLAVAVIGAAIWIIRNTGLGKSANVYSVDLLNVGYWLDSEGMNGVVTDGKIQKLEKKEAIIDEIRVNAGDTVNVGDVLLVYDTSSYRILIKQDEAEIAVLKADINQAQTDIQKYQGLRPAEEAPEPETKVIDHGELVIKDELTAADLKEDEMEFICSSRTIIKQDFLRSLREKKYSVTLKLYDDSQLLYGYYCIDGENIPEYIYVYEEISDSEIPSLTLKTVTSKAVPEAGSTASRALTSEETTEPETTTEKDSSYKRVLTDAIYEDWVLDNILKFDGENISADTSGNYSYYGTITACTPVEYERYEIIEIEPGSSGNDEDFIYTSAELASMISELQKQISDYRLKLRQAEIIYAEDLLTEETGEVKAKISGTVEKVNDVSAAAAGDEIMVIKGESNYTINVYVNELDLNKYEVGDEFDIYAYESGVSVTARVAEIGTDPASDYYASTAANPNSSYYPLITIAENAEAAMSVGESCSAMPVTAEDTSYNIYLPLMYVRSDTGGSYVMKSLDGRLKKQYVKTGKNLYGSYVEIKEGLTAEDYIAFPYDTGSKEGITAVITDNVEYY